MRFKNLEKKAVKLADNNNAAQEEAKNIAGDKGGVVFRHVPIEKVRVDMDTNRTLDPAKVDSIAEDIKNQGSVKPVLVHSIAGSGGAVHVEDGHHRVAALVKGGAIHIPVYEVNPEVHDAYNKDSNGFVEKYQNSKVRAVVR